MTIIAPTLEVYSHKLFLISIWGTSLWSLDSFHFRNYWGGDLFSQILTNTNTSA